jgi:SWI/SNF-related matrix-associated actin-dependent regulator of chromatin subfamily A member 5
MSGIHKNSGFIPLSGRSSWEVEVVDVEKEHGDDPVDLGAGKRKRKSRMMMINNQPVLKANNYDLESGEKSVFDRELNGVNEYAEWTPYPEKRAYKTPKPSKPRVVNPNVAHRLAENNSIRADKTASLARRADFIRLNWAVISPFLEAKLAKCPPMQSLAGLPPLSPPWVHQPSFIKNAVMRDYQLAGANFLIRSYENGINVILADEMGLGKTIQTIAYIGCVKFEMKKAGAFLIVVPLSGRCPN